MVQDKQMSITSNSYLTQDLGNPLAALEILATKKRSVRVKFVGVCQSCVAAQ